MIYVLIAIVAAFFVWLSVMISPKRGIPVLMYHKVLPDFTDDLTVSVLQLEEHLQFLQSKGYQILPLERLIGHVTEKEKLPANAVFITFDDGYLNNLKYAYPILERYHAPATIFLPTSYIGKTSSWDTKADDLMNVAQLKSLNPALISFGLHSHTHQNYKTAGIAEIANDLQNNIHFFKQSGLSFLPAFAYPYGGRPKNKILLKQMKEAMQSMGVIMAFRIGNRLNRSFKDNYELQRLDIRGSDSFSVFQKKLAGKAKISF